MVVESPPSVLSMVADPRRWRLLAELASTDRRVGELCELTGDPQNLVSYHLRCLRDAGLVTARRSSFDGRDAYYRVELDRCRRALCEAGAALDPALQLARAHSPSSSEPARRHRYCLRVPVTAHDPKWPKRSSNTRRQAYFESAARGGLPKPVHPNAVLVLARRGIDISNRSSKHFSRVARLRFDHVITLCDKVREVCPEFPGHPSTAHWSIPDPSIGNGDQDTLPAFEAVAVDLDERIRHLITRLAIHLKEENHAR